VGSNPAGRANIPRVAGADQEAKRHDAKGAGQNSLVRANAACWRRLADASALALDRTPGSCLLGYRTHADLAGKESR
jgi:hypothetical protein